jgi:hypothetical protein
MNENNSRTDIRAFNLTPAEADHYRAVLADYRRQRTARIQHRNVIISETAAVTIAALLIIIVLSLALTGH